MAKADKLKARMGLGGPPLERIRSAPPRLPDHEMVRRIGQGSYGEVWLARNAVGNWRAVKVVYRDYFRDARPYEREFSGIQKYEPISRANEGLVDVLQIGRDDTEGYFYYVMELADDGSVRSAGSNVQNSIAAPGETRPRISNRTLNPEAYLPKTLAREIHNRGKLPFDECLPLGLTLSLALSHLHRHGLIHRDVKPSNIIFVNGVPKLADIGLVTDLAEAQSFVGTEGFIPPEGPNSPQADLYALGKVLYEASMGKDRQEFPEPFTGLGLDAESKALMELSAVLVKACAASLKERYQSAEEMNSDLALLLAGKSVRRTHAMERRLAIMTRIGAVTAAVVVLGAVPYFLAIREARVASRLAKKEAAQRQRAEANEKKAQSEAAKNQQVAQFLKNVLEGAGPAAALGRDTTVLKEILNKTAKRLDTELTNQPEAVFELRQTLFDTYRDLGLYSEMEEMARKNLELAKSQSDQDHIAVPAALIQLGEALLFRGKLDEAEATAREAVDKVSKLEGRESLPAADTLDRLAHVLWTKGNLSEAEAKARAALGIRKKRLGNEHLDVATSLHDLGAVLIAEGKPAEAEPLFREALAIQENLLPEGHPNIANSLNSLAASLYRQGKMDEGEALQREALMMRKKVFGNEHPMVATALNNLGRILQDEGKLSEAEASCREALAIQKKLLGDAHPDVASSLENLAGVR